MAEDKKKFTFSDKIKTSKPGLNLFSKKGASKIGNNGKPKQTLFERTRRDAPFFVAAAAALLLLPFLYKYSGTVHDDVIVPPGAEDSVFDPERFGFSPSAEDPNGQIMQLAGRDPLSLIKGWGSPEQAQEEPETDYSSYNSRDGLDDDYKPVSRPDNSYRQSIPPATRAAFQRQATKIKEMRGASLNLRGGGGPGSRFGGAQLKAAARQSSAGRPKQGTKPVSLQPLRAAGNPSRSYFGQGGAAQARASRDAMTKSDAKQALRDAMFAPVSNGRVGGLGDGLFASGGGPGKFDRNMDFKGITPWWWDMMKDRAQKKWEWEYYLWRRGLVEPLIKALAEMLAKIGTNLGCCLIMGNNDCGDADTFLGSEHGTSRNPKCGDMEESHFKVVYKTEYENAGGNFEKACKALKKSASSQDKSRFAWTGGGGVNQKLGFFGQRWACLGGAVHGKGELALKDRFDCEAVNTTRNFSLQASGPATKWHTYHAVVVKNYVPFRNKGSHHLCVKSNRNVNKEYRTGVADVIDRDEVTPGGKNDAYNGGQYNKKTQGMKGAQFPHYYNAEEDPKIVNARTEGTSSYNDNHSCVIYVAEGDVFDWDTFKATTIGLLDELDLRYENDDPDTKDVNEKDQHVPGEKAFASLQLSFIEGYAFKRTLARREMETVRTVTQQTDKGVNNVIHAKRTSGMIDANVFPMTYADFEEFYILRRNSPYNDDSFKDNEKVRRFDQTYVGVDGKPRTMITGSGKPTAVRSRQCAFVDFRITAQTILDPAEIRADLSFNPNVYGKNAEGITVTAVITDQDNNEVATVSGLTPTKVKGGVARYQIPANVTPKVLQALTPKEGEEEGKVHKITVRWIAKDKNGKTSEDTADYEEDGTGVVIEEEITPVPPSEPDGLPGLLGDIPGVDKACMTDEQSRAAVQIADAQQFVKQVVAFHNQQKPEEQIKYEQNYPSIAQLMGAANLYIGEKGANAQMPKAAVCQMGKLVSLLFSDPHEPKLDNAFGTFATFIEEESIHFPTSQTLPKGQTGTIKDMRFLKDNSQVGQQWHFGNYVWKGQHAKQFGLDLRERQGYAQGGDLFPLKALSRLNGVTLDHKAGAEGKMRAAYWNAYRGVYQSGGCSSYGNETMEASEALRYIKMLCDVKKAAEEQNKVYLLKPRATTRAKQVGSGSVPISPAPNGRVSSRSLDAD